MAKLNSRKLASIERKIAQAMEFIPEHGLKVRRYTFDGLDTSSMYVDRTSLDTYYPHLCIPVVTGLLGEVFLHPCRLERIRKMLGSKSVQVVFWGVGNFYVNFYFD